MRNRKRIVFILIFVFVFVLKNQSIYSTTISNSRINNDNPRKRKIQSVGVQKELSQGFYKSKKERPTKIKSQRESKIQVMNSYRKEKKNLKQQTECLFPKDSPEVIGTEFRVNNFISGDQRYPSIASIGLNNNKFVITWSSDGDDNDGSDDAVLAKFYNSNDGSEIGEQFLVNNYTNGNQYNSKVRSILNGEKFVIAWHSNNQERSFFGIYIQIFDSNDGSKVGGEILVNNYTENTQSKSRICSTGQNGERFVVTWRNYNQVSDESRYDIYAQIFDSTTGNKIGSEFLVNNYTERVQKSPDICSIGENGTKIVIVWGSLDQDGDKSGIYAQIFNSTNGNNIGNEFLVNSITAYTQENPAISSIGQKNEKFVISWSCRVDEDQSGYDIHAQVYDSNDGSKIGDEFQINTGTTNDQKIPAISSIGENKEKFVITWQSYLYDSSDYGIYAQIYESNEISKIGEEFRVNTYTINDQKRPQISSIGQNLENFIISWQSQEQDGDGNGIYAQIFTTDFICNCNKGSYSNATNPESCFQCPLGTYQAEVGKTGCLECQSGQYQDKEGQSKCLDCEIGTYQDLESQSMCKACGNGTYQNSKAQTKCLSCGMGTYGNDDGLSECKLCPKGTYQNDEGQSECIKCRNGTINPNQGLTSIGSCVECELGSYQNQEGASECLQCPEGTYGNVKGAVVCQECSTGSYSYQIGSTVCSFCTTGTYQDEKGMINCKTCPFNEYQDQVGSNECNICPSNSETLSKQSASIKECFCMIGYYGKPGENCKKCPDEGICNEFNQYYPYPTSGYWSSNDDPYELIKCSIEIACPGYEVEKCNDTAGYTGSKCSECLNGFYKLEHECEKCPSNSNQRLFLILLVVFFFLLLLLFFAKKATAYFGSFTISFSFFQILLIIYQLNINWPTLLNDTFKKLLPFNFNLDFLATECSFSFD
ncbi:insulin-like growth factor binding protein [Anaeramoeba flamelloides]|uniref:Insulin-like growth factor binding protein n=1 Tax=Anaeramoeba flamelloides TaxID=1746091 RepID=A0ABQ8Y1H8_9EUKA|nr:insulin-like growth factor binding protein [Anaeramoeba flamelloides]